MAAADVHPSVLLLPALLSPELRHSHHWLQGTQLAAHKPPVEKQLQLYAHADKSTPVQVTHLGEHLEQLGLGHIAVQVTHIQAGVVGGGGRGARGSTCGRPKAIRGVHCVSRQARQQAKSSDSKGTAGGSHGRAGGNRGHAGCHCSRQLAEAAVTSSHHAEFSSIASAVLLSCIHLP